eukprot:6189260-Pleurochrysis_carterae.AAC.4
MEFSGLRAVGTGKYVGHKRKHPSERVDCRPCLCARFRYALGVSEVHGCTRRLRACKKRSATCSLGW